MIPVGYMAKLVQKKPDWLKAPNVIDIYSVSDCVSKNLADSIKFWKRVTAIGSLTHRRS
jgi:hypothetical protein